MVEVDFYCWLRLDYIAEKKEFYKLRFVHVCKIQTTSFQSLSEKITSEDPSKKKAFLMTHFKYNRVYMLAQLKKRHRKSIFEGSMC